MSSVQSLRDFISQRLTAAAAEIFTEFEKTIVQYEEEIDRQRRLLDITWRPELKLHRTDLQQVLICKEEGGGPDLERNSSLDQEEPGPPQIKEELEEKQLVLKQEAEVVTVTPAADGTNHSGPEPDMDQLLYQNSSDNKDSKSTRNEDPKPKSRDRNRSDGDTVVSSVKCDICGKSFKNMTLLRTHQRIHTGEKLHPCKVCGKRFTQNYKLLIHMRTHTGEKPYSCKICFKNFSQSRNLNVHMRIHTGEKPFPCDICSRRFTQRAHLIEHMRIHTGEKPHACTICHKTFIKRCTLITHTRTHTGEKPFSCEICLKSFTRSPSLTGHMRKHTGE